MADNADIKVGLPEITFKAPAEDVLALLKAAERLPSDTYTRMLFALPPAVYLELPPGVSAVTAEDLSDTVEKIIFGSANDKMLRSRARMQAVVILEQQPENAQAIFDKIMSRGFNSETHKS